MSSDDACDENWYDSGSGRAPPPQRCLGPAPGAPGWTGCLHSDVSVQSLRERERDVI